MNSNIDEIMERLKNMDQDSVVDMLMLSSDDIVNRFVDRIEDRMDYFENEFNLDTDDYE